MELEPALLEADTLRVVRLMPLGHTSYSIEMTKHRFINGSQCHMIYLKNDEVTTT